MTTPFVYTPVVVGYVATPYSYNSTPGHSPFIPPQPFRQSPYTPTTSLPPTPQTPNVGLPSTSQQVPPFPAAPPQQSVRWKPTRKRTLSTGYEGGDTLQPGTPHHSRRHSFGQPYVPPPAVPQVQAQASYQPTVTYSIPPAPWAPNDRTPVAVQVNPVLDGLNWQGRTSFALNSKRFSPHRVTNERQLAQFSNAEYLQPAVWPPVNRLRILCDLIPWPIELTPNPNQYPAGTLPPPITVADVLIAIHYNLHKQIGRADFDRLEKDKKDAVSRAYHKRCKMDPNLELVERGEGVKQVDFLRKHVWFRGLIPTPDPTVMKMIVDRPERS